MIYSMDLKSHIFSKQGLISIQDLKQNPDLFEKLFEKPPIEILSIKSNLLKITTNYGYAVTLASDCVLPGILKNEKDVISAPLSKYQVGDALLLNVNNPENATNFYRFDNEGFDPIFKYPLVMGYDLAKVLGILYATKHKNNIYEIKTKDSLLAFLKPYTLCFGWYPLLDKKDKGYTFSLFPYVQKWLNHISFGTGMPRCLLTAPIEVVLEFLLTFTGLDTFGSKKRVFSFNSRHSELFIKQIRLLFLRLGYITKKVSKLKYTIVDTHTTGIENSYIPVSIESVEDIGELDSFQIEFDEKTNLVVDGILCWSEYAR